MRKLFAVVVLLFSVSQAKADGVFTYIHSNVPVFGIDDIGQLLVSTQNGPYLCRGAPMTLLTHPARQPYFLSALSENGTILGKY